MLCGIFVAEDLCVTGQDLPPMQPAGLKSGTNLPDPIRLGPNVGEVSCWHNFFILRTELFAMQILATGRIMEVKVVDIVIPHFSMWHKTRVDPAFGCGHARHDRVDDGSRCQVRQRE